MKTQLNGVYLKQFLKKNLNRGFSLTELLLVIVMTGVMPAIIMPYVLHHANLHEAQISLGD